MRNGLNVKVSCLDTYRTESGTRRSPRSNSLSSRLYGPCVKIGVESTSEESLEYKIFLTLYKIKNRVRKGHPYKFKMGT